MSDINNLDLTSSRSDQECQIINGCDLCISQCESLLREISTDHYCHVEEGHSSVGAHMRHILDRYLSFFKGINSGCIDYDDRQRDKSIETNPQAAEFALTSIARRIKDLNLDTQRERTITMQEAVHHSGPAVAIGSTVNRELMALVTHSIHHLAIIALIVRPFGYELGADFGKAPSTIIFERQ